MMHRDGYEVFSGVLTEEECARVRSRRPRQWNHSRVMWDVRCHPNVKRVFADLWEVRPDDLLTSFDGVFHRTAGTEFTLPWHMDQNASHPFDTMSSVQGILALSDIDATTGGTQFLEGSHLRTKGLCYRLNVDTEEDTWEFTQVDEADRVFAMGLQVVQPSLKQGDLLLWDSRTLHRVVAPTDARSERWTAYLSMVPRSMVSDRVRSQRKEGFFRGATTTHWVQTFVDRGEEACPPPSNVVRDPKVLQMV